MEKIVALSIFLLITGACIYQTSANACTEDAHCENGGSCNTTDSANECICTPQWEGFNCTDDVDECAVDDPCQNGGTCNNTEGGYNCTCPPTHIGTDCETELVCSYHHQSTCGGRGTCESGRYSYACTCDSGYMGTECAEYTICAEAEESLCSEHGTCAEDNGAYACTCDAYFDGAECDACHANFTNYGANCTDDACLNATLCANGGTCNDGVCSCAAGYDGNDCTNDIDDCSPNPCLNGGVCTDGVDEYNCTCATGYEGTNCATALLCADDADGQCSGEGNCVASECVCNTGYNGTECEDTECPLDENGNFCSGAGACENGNCTCDAGYKGDNCETMMVCMEDGAGSLCSNRGTCSQSGGNYSCSCLAGFTGTDCESCASGYIGEDCYELVLCVDGDCQNSGVCQGVSGNDVCVCSAGYSGSLCELEIDECDSNPCLNGGTCTDGVNSFTCACDTGFAGTTCDASYGEWGAFGDCTQTCGDATQTRNRSCVDGDGGELELSVCADIGLSSDTAECTGLPECPCTVNPCKNSTGGHTDAPCNLEGQDIHTCTEEYDAVTSQCSLKCECASGYEATANNDFCVDIKECTVGGGECFSTGTTLHPYVTRCVELEGTYECVCADGYEHADGDMQVCTDIDECSDGIDDCDDSPRATCTDTSGSYECACDADFTGSGTAGTCKRDRFVLTDYTSSPTQTLTDSDMYSTMTYIPLAGYAIWDDYTNTSLSINSMYATKSGCIVFSSYRSQDASSVVQKAFPQPTADSLEDMSAESLNALNAEVVAVAAVYWADNKIPGDGGVYVQFIENITGSAVEAAATTAISDAEWAYVVTWDKMVPNTDQAAASEMNTYQAMVVGSADREVVTVLYIYQDREMLWDIPVWGSGSLGYYPARIGVIYNAYGTVPSAIEYGSSGLSTSGYSSQAAWEADKQKIQMPDQYTSTGTAMAADSGSPYFTMVITDLTLYTGDAEYESPAYACQSAIDVLMNETADAEFVTNITAKCAGTLELLVVDVPVVHTSEADWTGADYECYAITEAAVGLNYITRCCYDASGVLVPSTQAAVSATAGASSSLLVDTDTYDSPEKIDGLRMDALDCCDSDLINEGLANSDLCASYLTYRPASSSQVGYTSDYSYVAQVRGDPHFDTFDGYEYTFNDFGTFLLLNTDGDVIDSPDDQFVAQVRLGSANTNNEAAIVVGVVAKFYQHVVSLEFNADKSALILSVNGTDTGATWAGEEDLAPGIGAGMQAYLCGVAPFYCLRFSLADGTPLFLLRVKADVTAADPLMTVTVYMSSDYDGNDVTVEGLLGDNDGDNSNDEISNFAPVTVSSGDNLFADADPTIDNSAIVAVGDIVSDTDAETLCGTDTECLYDYQILGEVVAAETLDSKARFKRLRAEIQATTGPPAITNSEEQLQVTVGESSAVTLTVAAEDASGSNADITYELINAPSGVTISGAVISWSNAVYSATGALSVKVTDSNNVTTVHTYQVGICNCQNSGTCVWESDSPLLWYVARCNCAAGYVGQFCDTDEDNCADNPCFTTCTDVPATQLSETPDGYLCADCPAGMTGDGKTCSDANECLDSPCNHTCENTAGSYTCSCDDGYALGADQSSCSDIDECLLQTDDCDSDATCTNTAGSWECACDSGYEGTGVDGDCTDVDECSSDVCPDNSNCVNSEGSYSCECVYGYEEDGDECVEINECDLGNDCSQTCVDGIGLYICECGADFDLSTDDLVTCTPKTGQECTADEKTTNCGDNVDATCAKDTSGAILCYCPQGYSLSENDCVDIDECSTGASICSQQSSNCSNTAGSYVCQCFTGYERSDDGITCEDVDECALGTDSCNQVCVNTDGSYECDCLDGYTMGSDGTTCADTDECANDLFNMCGGTCTNQVMGNTYPLGYSCSCASGYEMSDDGFSCIDVNECLADDKGGCEQGCTNSDGSYSCYCRSGYTLNADNEACDNVNECQSDNNCYGNATFTFCTDTNGSYTCGCPSGFSLRSDGYSCKSDVDCTSTTCTYFCNVIDGTETCSCPLGYSVNSTDQTAPCVDDDECTDDTLCPSANNVMCVNTDGAYRCDCTNGSYSKLTEDSCVDINECTTGAATCPENSACVNSDPGYSCECNTGYTASSDGTCVETNECLSSALNICNDTLATCTNTAGSYTCACNEGYSGNGVECTDENECVSGHSCETRADRGFCTNTIGSYTCGCYSGYTISSTNVCNDINECSDTTTYNVQCSQNCDNTPGSFKCSCLDGYALAVDGYTCNPLVECATTNQCTQDCVKIAGNDTCTCISGYVLNSDGITCDDVNECYNSSLNTCDTTRGNCSNTEGSYECTCRDGYTLGPNNECDDRDGGVGEWTEWSSCTASCGADGTSTRSRACDTPTKQGDGADCSEELAEIRLCNISVCPELIRSGVQIRYEGLSVNDFQLGVNRFKEIIAREINTDCLRNVSDFMACCNQTATLVLPSSSTTLVTSSDVDIFLTAMTQTEGTIAIIGLSSSPADHATCSVLAGGGSRRKRNIYTPTVDDIFLRDILNDLLDDDTLRYNITTELVNYLVTDFGLTIDRSLVSAGAVQSVEQLTTTTASSGNTGGGGGGGSNTEETTEKPSGQSWVIAVAVVGAIVGVAIIIIVAVIIVKKKSAKVSSDDNDRAA